MACYAVAADRSSQVPSDAQGQGPGVEAERPRTGFVPTCSIRLTAERYERKNYLFRTNHMRMLCSLTPEVNLPGIVVAGQDSEYRAPLNDIKKFEGKSIGYGKFKGECAAGVQWALRQNKVMIGLTSSWKPGRKVRGNVISPGTAIASFRDGVYRNDHAAIFVSQDAKGITVYDQYNHPKKPWGKRVLRFDLKTKDDYSNDGEYFYTIIAK